MTRLELHGYEWPQDHLHSPKVWDLSNLEVLELSSVAVGIFFESVGIEELQWVKSLALRHRDSPPQIRPSQFQRQNLRKNIWEHLPNLTELKINSQWMNMICIDSDLPIIGKTLTCLDLLPTSDPDMYQYDTAQSDLDEIFKHCKVLESLGIMCTLGTVEADVVSYSKSLGDVAEAKDMTRNDTLTQWPIKNL